MPAKAAPMSHSSSRSPSASGPGSARAGPRSRRRARRSRSPRSSLRRIARAAGATTHLAMASGMRTASVRCSHLLTVTSRAATSRRRRRGWHCTRTRAGRVGYARVAARVRTQPRGCDEAVAGWLSPAPPPGDRVLSGDRRAPRDDAARRTRSVAPWLRAAASRRGWISRVARLRRRGTRLRARRVSIVSVRDPRPVQLQSPWPVPVVRWSADGGWCS